MPENFKAKQKVGDKFSHKLLGTFTNVYYLRLNFLYDNIS